MRDSVPEEATCAICGRHFDPSETRGWCPNPSCGEWRHPFFPIDGEPETSPDADVESDPSTSEPTKTCPSCGKEVREDANFCKHCAHAFDDETAEQPPQPDPGGLECPDCGKDLSGIPTDRLSRCPICMFDLGPDFAESEELTEPDHEGITACPNCGEDLTPIPSEMRTVCPGCRVDLDEGLKAASEPPAGTREASAESTGDDPSTAAIEAVDAVEPGFEPRLEEAGVTTVGDLVHADPDDLSRKTGISARRISGWIEDARAETAVSPPEPTAEADAVHFDETRIQRAPDELVFEVMGREISVTDGQTVGSEIRSAMVAAGASKQDAVYVHRKHVRVEADDGEFFLTRLGENSLELNGNPIDRGRRIAIGDGDEITFSDVVTVTVSVR